MARDQVPGPHPGPSLLRRGSGQTTSPPATQFPYLEVGRSTPNLLAPRQGKGVQNSSEVKAGQTWGYVLGLLPLTGRGRSAHMGEAGVVTMVTL